MSSQIQLPHASWMVWGDRCWSLTPLEDFLLTAGIHPLADKDVEKEKKRATKNSMSLLTRFAAAVPEWVTVLFGIVAALTFTVGVWFAIFGKWTSWIWFSGLVLLAALVFITERGSPRWNRIPYNPAKDGSQLKFGCMPYFVLERAKQLLGTPRAPGSIVSLSVEHGERLAFLLVHYQSYAYAETETAYVENWRF